MKGGDKMRVITLLLCMAVSVPSYASVVGQMSKPNPAAVAAVKKRNPGAGNVAIVKKRTIKANIR